MVGGSKQSSVSTGAEALEVQWADGRVTVLPNLWLRDNCACAECRLPQTGEKIFRIGNVAVDLQPADAIFVGAQLQVTWLDGHVSNFTAADIGAFAGRVLAKWVPWGDGFLPRRFDYQSFLHDDRMAVGVIEAFLQDGVCILENSPVQPGTLEELAPRLGPVREVLFDRIHNVEVYADGYNVAHTALDLPPHNDFPSYSWSPSVQALHMLINDTPGGESTIVDGWQLLRKFRQEHPVFFESLCTMPVAFRQFDADHETYAVSPLVRCNLDGEINELRFSNQLMQRMDPARPGVGLFYRAYHELCRRITDPANSVCFRLESGEVLLLAAHRVLHGRKKFTPVAKRHLQDAYFELDNIKGHLVVLRRGTGE